MPGYDWYNYLTGQQNPRAGVQQTTTPPGYKKRWPVRLPLGKTSPSVTDIPPSSPSYFKEPPPVVIIPPGYTPPPNYTPGPGFTMPSSAQLQQWIASGWIPDPAHSGWWIGRINDPTRFRQVLQQYQSSYANPYLFATGTNPFYESDEGQGTGYQDFLGSYGGSRSSYNWLRSQESPLRAQFDVVRAANQEASWMDFLKGLNLNQMMAAATPYARGENPATFLGRGRRSTY